MKLFKDDEIGPNIRFFAYPVIQETGRATHKQCTIMQVRPLLIIFLRKRTEYLTTKTIKHLKLSFQLCFSNITNLQLFIDYALKDKNISLRKDFFYQ